VADATTISLADWKGEARSRWATRTESPERALSARVRRGAGVRARISRSATASGPRAFISYC